jgi:two-component system response regulator HydG
MPLPLQAKLLRVLETREVVRIGSNEPVKVNVRVLSATHKDLEAMVAEGKFRQDLLFRLKVVTVKLPALRERREDIQLLAAHFVRDLAAANGKTINGIAEPVRKAMALYDWPGNVRELRNFVESAVVQDLDGIIGLDDITESDVISKAPSTKLVGANNLVGRSLSEVERYYIEQALALTNNNREEAARMLGIGERTLYRVIQDWKLQDRIREAFRAANGDLAEAARLLNMKPAELTRRIKKWGWEPGQMPATDLVGVV